MGIADLYDARTLPISPAEWVQHMIRYHTGQFVHGSRGHRVIWAMVNTVLIGEASGKGFAVHRNLLRRQGFRSLGSQVLTKGRLRAMLEDEEAIRSIVHQLMVVGRDVRTTPMHWAYQGKQLDCIVRHLSWRPPWVRLADEDEDGNDIFARLGSLELVDGQRVPGFRVIDSVGLGRSAYSWYTINCPYNTAYDIHRLNVGAAMNEEAVAVGDGDMYKQVRRDFIRDSPDIACFNVVLRTELIMKMVMPEIVPHSAEYPFLSMIRFESGAGGNHHGHGFTAGMGNPRLTRIDSADEDGSDSCVGSGADAAGQACATGGSDADNDLSDEPTERARSESDMSDGQCVDIVGPGLSNSSPVLAPLASEQGRVLKRRRTPVLVAEPISALPERRLDASQRGQNKAQLEREFWQCYGKSVSEWNPSFSADGQQRIRFHWDPDVGAHDVEMMMPKGLDELEPSRSNLRCVLDEVLGGINNGSPLDLTPLRRLLAACVQKYGRHDHHGKGPPFEGKHPCARGDDKSVHCRYGFPHKLHERDTSRPFALERGERKGSWFARFPRNDELCCSHEVHLMLANLGNLDWRPCLNLWAVVEYITKYAMKAASGSRQLADVLRDVIDEVCKYTEEGEGVDYLRKSLQKFYSRTLGERSYGIFEAVHLGLQLPMVIPMMPVVSLNTFGTRRLKTSRELAFSSDDAPVSWDSKVDKFDKRLGLVRQQFAKHDLAVRQRWEREVRDVSLYEFFWKYNLSRGRLYVSKSPAAIMVTPAVSGNSAAADHPHHAFYARMCVVAFWRTMPTSRRYALMEHVADCSGIIAAGVVLGLKILPFMLGSCPRCWTATSVCRI